jgi:hypothetical protein
MTMDVAIAFTLGALVASLITVPSMLMLALHNYKEGIEFGEQLEKTNKEEK